MSTRRRFSGDFKAKVALEAVRREKTTQEIAVRHKIHPNQVSTWKERAVEGMILAKALKWWPCPGLEDRLVKLPVPSARSLLVSGSRGWSGEVADCRTPR